MSAELSDVEPRSRPRHLSRYASSPVSGPRRWFRLGWLANGFGFWVVLYARVLDDRAPFFMAVCLAAACAFAVAHLCVSWGRSVRGAISILIGMGVLAMLSLDKESRSVRSKESDDDRVITEYSNLWGWNTNRVISGRDLFAHGPTTASGKRHGHWVYLRGRAYYELWYWYGDEVSEGRWHELAGR